MSDHEACHVVFAADEKFSLQLDVVVSSALLHNTGLLVIHILDCQEGGYSSEMWNSLLMTWARIPKREGSSYQVIRHPIDMSLFSGFQSWNGSLATYARLLLGDLLPDVSLCLYSDCDVLFLRDPMEVFRWADGKQFAIAGHKNGADGDMKDFPFFERHKLTFDREHYFCAGFILMNLDWLRAHDMRTVSFEFLSRYPDSVAADQCPLNYISAGSIALLPDGWGNAAAECFSIKEEIGAIHYAATAPWKRNDSWYTYLMYQDTKNLWIDFAEKVLRKNGMRSRFLPVVDRVKYAPIACCAEWICRIINFFHIPVPVRQEFLAVVREKYTDSKAIARARRRIRRMVCCL